MIEIVLAAAVLTDIHLICEGEKGGSVVAERSSGSITDGKGNYVFGGNVKTRPGVIRGIVTFKMEGGEAKLHVPGQYLTNSWKSGDAGWFDVKRLKVTENEISGKAQTAILSATVFRIDRVTGVMTTKSGFQGLCVPVDTTQRAF